MAGVGTVHAVSGQSDAPLLQLEVSAATEKGLARHAQARLLHCTALPRFLRQSGRCSRRCAPFDMCQLSFTVLSEQCSAGAVAYLRVQAALITSS